MIFIRLCLFLRRTQVNNKAVNTVIMVRNPNAETNPITNLENDIKIKLRIVYY
ncbi:hypothetical protein [uncultured Algibacter sp.]|uniref:hypothetical protein n=1 Tax=uncultured Algibacter sp. TaxID=298659 RepID=UPI0030EE530C